MDTTPRTPLTQDQLACQDQLTQDQLTQDQMASQDQSAQSAMPGLFAGTGGASGMDVFQNYALHVPFGGSGGELMSWPKLSETSPTAAERQPRAPTTQKRRSTMPQPSRGHAERAFFRRVRQERELSGSDGTSRLTVRMHPQVDRGFFISDSDWTCYRRNYFQVSCMFTLSGATAESPVYVVGDNGLQLVQQFRIGIGARVSGNSGGVELVQHTPKRDKGPQMTPEPQPVRRSDSGLVDVGSSVASFERLQFKTATANNGKRRAAQQYYVLELTLLADCVDGSHVRVASTESPPIVVRGRSPGHYADPGRRPTHKSSASDTPGMLPGRVPGRASHGRVSSDHISHNRTAAMAASLSHGDTRPHAPPPGAARSQSSDVLGRGFSSTGYPDVGGYPEVSGYPENGGYPAPEFADSSTAAVVAALAAATGDPGFGLSADDMVQALTSMVPSVLPPQEILARAQMGDALGLANIGLKPKPADDVISSGMTLSMAASIAGNVPDALQALEIHPPLTQPASLDASSQLDTHALP
ncbi:hypothetical protein GGH96_000379 [Coemansia sp. RSA 1972]|nr:hypothetical protein GGH96_000379 [Coemansia sp. RSA 1972]